MTGNMFFMLVGCLWSKFYDKSFLCVGNILEQRLSPNGVGARQIKTKWWILGKEDNVALLVA